MVRCWRCAAVAFSIIASGCTDDDSAVVEPTVTEETVDAETLPTSETPPGAYEEGTIMAALHGDDRFETFVALIEQRLPSTFLRFFQAPNWPNTLLAPTDEAFEHLDPEALATLLRDDALLATVMRYHVISDGPLMISELDDEHLTVAGPVEVVRRGGDVYVAGVQVLDSGVAVNGSDDGEATNTGLIHMVNDIIRPCAHPLVDQHLDDCTG